MKIGSTEKLTKIYMSIYERFNITPYRFHYLLKKDMIPSVIEYKIIVLTDCYNFNILLQTSIAAYKKATELLSKNSINELKEKKWIYKRNPFGNMGKYTEYLKELGKKYKNDRI